MKKVFLASCLIIFPSIIFAQEGLNTQLIGQINYGRYTNDVWGYIDSLGNDYAIVGLIDGVSVVRVDSTMLTEVGFIPGANSVWRDIKTHEQYAYVTADQGADGLTIIDLSDLPNSIELVTRLTTYFSTAHNLYIADGFAYISGSNASSGADILDLSNPTSPVRVGGWVSDYFHDIFVHGDTLYGSAGGQSRVLALDVSDKTNPMLIGELPFPDGGYSHNSWATEDGRYLLTTQETANLTVKMWDVSDLQNPTILHEYLSSPSRLAHNAHILGDFAHISHYADGLRILDISDPAHMVEVGNYDTNPSEATNFDGNWGAFPFTASGYIYVTDQEFGLFVVSFNGQRGTRLSGIVRDQASGEPVPDVEMRIVETGKIVITDESGNFKLGFPAAGEYAIELTKFGYYSESFDVDLIEASTGSQDFLVQKKPTGQLSGFVVDEDGVPIFQPRVQILNTPFEGIVGGGEGSYGFSDIPEGDYQLVVGHWGYRVEFPEITVLGNQDNRIDFGLETGYEDNFELDLGWLTGGGSANNFGPWRMITPEELQAELGVGLPFVPPADATPDPGHQAFYARVLSTEVTLTSPLLDLTGMDDPVIQYQLFWFPRGDGDLLRVDLSENNGQTWQPMEFFGPSDATADWTQVQHRVSDVQMPGSAMRVRFTSIEGGSASSLAYLDDFKIVTGTSTGGPDDEVPSVYGLAQNYPNPFNGETLIVIDLPKEDRVELKIYDLRGHEIMKLNDGVLPGGQHVFRWNGFDESGKRVTSGLYFYRMRAEGFEQTRKMVLVY